MAYKIAVASSDGVNIDRSFGASDAFDIYEAEGTEYHLVEKREYTSQEVSGQKDADGAGRVLTESSVENKEDCGGGMGCSSSGGCGSGRGCATSSGTFPKVQLIRDCRCIVCEKSQRIFKTKLEVS